MLPPKPSLELTSIDQEVALRLGIKQAEGSAKVYSADGQVLNKITVPSNVGGGVAGDAAALREALGDDAVLPRPTFGDGGVTAAELHSVPTLSGGSGEESGAVQVARRVKERREELQARGRHRVNVYAQEEMVVETSEEAYDAKKKAGEIGAGTVANALMGLG